MPCRAAPLNDSPRDLQLASDELPSLMLNVAGSFCLFAIISRFLFGLLSNQRIKSLHHNSQEYVGKMASDNHIFSPLIQEFVLLLMGIAPYPMWLSREMDYDIEGLLHGGAESAVH